MILIKYEAEISRITNRFFYSSIIYDNKINKKQTNKNKQIVIKMMMINLETII
jgi:hypothetical protein